MLSALAPGESTIEGLSPGLDVGRPAQIVEQLGRPGADDGRRDRRRARPTGCAPADAELDCANSGTTMRLLAGLVSAAMPGEHNWSATSRCRSAPWTASPSRSR
jgi:3-phosphoshikimate 1-carboxyvinyltransferase